MRRLTLTPPEPLAPPWQAAGIGSGRVTTTAAALRLTLGPTPDSAYGDAQISDYGRDRAFAWKPPVRLNLTVWASHDGAHLRGTAGFGFWNHPFSPDQRGFRPPAAAWFFFSSPPSEMALAQGVPGPGWKAATLDATRPRFLALLPTAPVGVLLMRVPALYRRLWPIGQRALGVSEAALDGGLLAERHTYSLDWQANRLAFAVDSAPVLTVPWAPRGPLGFIAWIDNQYAVVTPQGRLGFGLVSVAHAQMLLIESVVIEGG